MSTYDFDLALAQHAMWVTRLKLFTMGVGEQGLTPVLAADDSACELGRWLAQAPEACKALPQYQRLVEVHAHFHDLAGQVVEMAQKGDGAEVDLLLGTTLPEASNAVSQLLLQLRALDPCAQAAAPPDQPRG